MAIVTEHTPKDLRLILRTMRDRARVSMASKTWWFSTVLFVGIFASVVNAALKAYGVGGVIPSLAVFAYMVQRSRRVGSPEIVKQVESEYLERKAEFYALIKTMCRRDSASSAEVHAFQEATLRLIASYVRGHRADRAGKEVFVNLLVEEGDDLVVVARNVTHREPRARYPKRTLLAWQALTSGDAMTTGDVEQDFGTVGKPYKSILAIPIRGQHRILAVLSVDSSRKHQFDDVCKELDRYLMPYIALLEWTLLPSDTIQ